MASVTLQVDIDELGNNELDNTEERVQTALEKVGFSDVTVIETSRAEDAEDNDD